MSLSRAAWVLLGAAAVAPVAPSGCRRPSARVDEVRLEGTRPELVLLRCRTRDLLPPVKWSWLLGPGLRMGAWGEPLTEDALLVGLAAGPPTAACRAVGADGVTVDATINLGPIAITAVTAPSRAPGALLTVEGSGLGPARAEGDAVWLVPSRGAAVAADHGCKGAQWTDTRVVACLPDHLPSRPLQVRIASGGRLGLGGPLPVAK